MPRQARTARTDIHRPSAIVPADYEHVGYVYLGGNEDALDLNDYWGPKPVPARPEHHLYIGACDICGAHFVYGAEYHHLPTNRLLTIGHDCASKMNLSESRGHEFRSWRELVRQGLEVSAGGRKARFLLWFAGLSAAWDIAEWKHPAVVAAQTAYAAACALHDADAGDREAYRAMHAADAVLSRVYTASDIVRKLIKYGSISDAQARYLASLVSQIEGTDERTKARAEAQAERAANSRHIGTVGKREVLTLIIGRVFEYDTDFGRLYVHLMSAGANAVVYKGSKQLGDAGETITVKATVKEHGQRDGVAQTVLSRPVVQEVVA